MSTNIETNILDSIELLVDNAVSNASYDKTITCLISKTTDAALGKYTVSYQGSSFYAYSTSIDVSYSTGTYVYVLVPGNDMGQTKTILGTVDKLGTDYITLVEGENGYDIFGNNVVKSNSTYGLCSYEEADIVTLYDKAASSNKLEIDLIGAELYFKNADAMICGANFKTSLNTEQKFRGDYGIGFDLDFNDNATGELITRTYLINIDQMTGNPYEFTQGSRQTGIYEIDGSNFNSINKIYIFSYNFPNIKSNMEDDIFISEIELNAANQLDADEAASYSLSIITPQGVYFDANQIGITEDETRLLQAEVRVKGQVLNSDSSLLSYYWFKENNKITSVSSKYNRFGGAGWECLNESMVIQEAEGDIEEVVEWISASPDFYTKKSDNVAKETTYKCVGVYNSSVPMSKTVTIYNFDSDYDITISSDSGTAFFYDTGTPTLTCLVNGAEVTGSEYEYVWSSVDAYNNFTSLIETTDYNLDYNEKASQIQDYYDGIENGTYLEGQVQDAIAKLESEIAIYQNIMRIELNKILKLNVSSIVNFTSYKCSVYRSGIFIGNATSILTNSIGETSGYSANIINGSQIFKYNVNGVSPASASMESPQVIMPLSFVLYDEKGNEIDHSQIDKYDIYWTVPVENTMISISTDHGSYAWENEDGTVTYRGYYELFFSINLLYQAASLNNDIVLTIDYKDNKASTVSRFTFLKEGENGSNGTDFVLKIVPKDGSNILKYPIWTYNHITSGSTFSYSGVNNTYFEAQLWKNGENIYQSNLTGNSLENLQAKITWSMQQNKYDYLNSDVSNFSINETTGAMTFISDAFENPANIVKCSLVYDDVEYYAFLPITLIRIYKNDYSLGINESDGFRSVLYVTDGTEPAYDSTSPFGIETYQQLSIDVYDENGNTTQQSVKENISLLTSNDYKVDYTWKIHGYDGNKTVENLYEKQSYGISSNLNRNQKYFVPNDLFDGLAVTNGISCVIDRLGVNVAEIHMPIYMALNRFGNAALNGWDGNSISIDEEGGVILAPQVGAGYKDANNAFTGIFMGSIKESGSSDVETGLYGYYTGERTIALSATDGSARFGKAGEAQIIIDPSEGEAIIKSGNFTTGNNVTGEPGAGLEINLSEPSITFGSGNFSIDKDGNVVANGYTTSGEFNDFAASTVVSTVILYGISFDKDTIPGDAYWYIDGFGIDIIEGQYLWQKTRETYGDGSVIETEPIRVTSVSDTITSVIQEYLLHPSTSTAEPESLNNLSGWKIDKPAWQENYDLWIRTKTIWASDPNTPIYSTPYKDLEVESLQGQITDTANDILNSLGEEGCVRITEDKIFILDRPTIETSKNVVVMSDEGFLFTDSGLQWNSTKEQWELSDSATSTWSIDGTYNGTVANIGEIFADHSDIGEIKLRQMNLTDSPDSDTIGQMKIYDSNNSEVANLSYKGFSFEQEVGGKTLITKENGLEGYGKGNLKIYGNLNDRPEEGFEAETLVVNNEIIFADMMNTVNVVRTSSGITNQGIGFCKYLG